MWRVGEGVCGEWVNEVCGEWVRECVESGEGVCGVSVTWYLLHGAWKCGGGVVLCHVHTIIKCSAI